MPAKALNQKQSGSFLGLSLSPAEWRIFSRLLLLSNARGQASESFSALAKICQLSRKTVITSIQNLKARRLLKVVMRTAWGGQNVYVLNPPVGYFQFLHQVLLMSQWLALQCPRCSPQARNWSFERD
jgi:Helix-turn-helix domain